MRARRDRDRHRDRERDRRGDDRRRSRSRERDRRDDRPHDADDRERGREEKREDRGERATEAPREAGKTEVRLGQAPVNLHLAATHAALPPPKDVGRALEPVSIEVKLQELKKSKEDAAKPVFMTKAQRQQAALERLEQDRKDRERAQEEARKQREEMQRELRAERDAERRGQRGQREEERARERERERRAAAGEGEAGEAVISEKELQVVKARYLGVGKIKKKVVKVTDKHRFAFDWEASEDTSADVNPLYSKKHEAQLLFGRGLRAGIDMREQKKKSTYVENLEAVREKIAAEGGGEVDGEERAQQEEMKQKLKEAYASRAKFSEDKKMALPGQHWSEKPLTGIILYLCVRSRALSYTYDNARLHIGI